MAELLLTNHKGLCFIISAPAGTGKTTLVRLLIQEFPTIRVNVSYTTRIPRAQEVDGKDYHFITRSSFEEKIGAGDFLEHITLYGEFYGTSRQWIEEQRKQGHHIILVIDIQGALRLKEQLDAIFIFISPPSLEVLRERLKWRKTETEETLEARLAWAEKEMQAISRYDYHIVNDDLQTAYQILRSIIIAESHRIKNFSLNKET